MPLTVRDLSNWNLNPGEEETIISSENKISRSWCSSTQLGDNMKSKATARKLFFNKGDQDVGTKQISESRKAKASAVEVAKEKAKKKRETS